jgi:hypothetical protein
MIDEEYSTSPQTATRYAAGCTTRGHGHDVRGQATSNPLKNNQKRGVEFLPENRILRVWIGVDKYGRSEWEGEVPNDLCVRDETRGFFWICTECRSKPAEVEKGRTDWSDGNRVGEVVVWT